MMVSKVSVNRWGVVRRMGAIAALAVVLPWIPGEPSVARSVMPVSPCQGATQLPANHPDIQALKSLIQKYQVKGANLGDRPITRYEFAIALEMVIEHIQAIMAPGNTSVSDADSVRLQQLGESYGSELSLLDSQQSFRGRMSGAAGNVFLQNGGLSNANVRIAPTAPVTPPPVGLPAPKPQPAPPPSAALPPSPLEPEIDRDRPPSNTEGYNPITDNPFFRPDSNPLSTFSIDVDTASYSNIRRFISQGQRPPKDAVRIEELINYFSYDYPAPERDKPFSVSTDVSRAPWNPKHQLVHIGLKGHQIAPQSAPPSNLVFLVDVSGSMGAPNKLPLVKQSLCMLVNELKSSDRVSMVVYAGNAGMVLPPTSGAQKEKIMQAIDRLESGGSTAGGEGIQLAYKVAKENLIKNGNNRVILATDGDFNVGVSSDAELVRLIEEKRDQGIYLTVLGFGTGNYKDSKMEQLADKGNGNYAYIDTLAEARKVLVNDLRSTLFTIAKDVKIQVEFNPAKVQAYRLIGYENRVLNHQDFNDDKKDAGEIGAGHTVTALYEVIPTGIASDVKLPTIDPLKYQKPSTVSSSTGNELLQVKLRYKLPNSSTSQLITQPVMDEVKSPSANLQFASAVAMFGMVLRDSEYKGSASLRSVLDLARQSQGNDPHGYRQEFIQLVQLYGELQAQK